MHAIYVLNIIVMENFIMIMMREKNKIITDKTKRHKIHDTPPPESQQKSRHIECRLFLFPSKTFLIIASCRPLSLL